MEAVILAGGMGTRLKSVVSDRPKVLASVGGKPFLDYLLEYLIHYKTTKVVLSVCYKKEQIKARYGKRFQDLSIAYADEEEPLGTGGAIQKSLQFCESEEVFVLNGDSILLVSLSEIASFHQKKGAQVTLAVRKVPDGNRYGGVIFDSEGVIRSFTEKKLSGPAYINGGVYCVKRSLFLDACEGIPPPFSVEKDLFPKMIGRGGGLYAFPADVFFVDIGLPESLKTAEEELPAKFPFDF